ncbi:LUD domain-containing protein [Sphingobacterium bambusae]|uniref:LUD domain-containing protein n=1 Tax=Sphingobacterium bambusae TaxID=662858 RepID=A0ABW6BIG6_9SPHI|nr:LUD domain-containing protein [Sphingobacterium bambusae]WPL50172.1 LUD domain-containing protein [Sphingobacterium bambusae]
MAQQLAEKFIRESTAKSFDKTHREMMKNNLHHFQDALSRGTAKFFDLENSKKKAHLLKWKAVENLDRYLLDFESNFTRRGGKVIWANDVEEAREEITRILEQHEAKSIVKTASIVFEELGLSDYLGNKGFDITETDTGSFIARLLQEKPSNFISSAGYLDRSTVAKKFHEQFDCPLEATAEQLIEKVNELLYEKFLRADVGISGANFLVADSGSIAITENEGNARLISTFPKIHISIAGIDNVVPSVHDMDLFWPLLASHSSSQNPATYNSLLSGPRQNSETDGPKEMYVILLDNGRSNLLTKKEQRQGLYCIRCGACLHVCPVYQSVGADGYGITYPGPIGSMVAPHLQQADNLHHLSFATPLDGEASSVCPVHIELDKMLLLNRKEAVTQHLVGKSEQRFWSGFAYLFQRRRLLDFFGGKTKNFLFKRLLKKAWGDQRDFPKLADKSFSKQWREQEKRKDQ